MMKRVAQYSITLYATLCCRFYLIDFLLSKPRIARYLFDRFRTKENLRTVLQVLTLKSRFQCLSTACTGAAALTGADDLRSAGERL